jgi:hypothetical protein
MAETNKKRIPSFGVCENCDREFNQNARGTKRYCSAACKQAEFRARRPAPASNDSQYATPIEKAIATKRNQLRSKTCPQCGMYFDVNGFQHQKRYCSAACKVAYHRAYKRLIEEYGLKFPDPRPTTPQKTDSQKIYEAWRGALE